MAYEILLDTYEDGPPGNIADADYRVYHRDSVIVSIDTVANFRLKDWQQQRRVFVEERSAVYAYLPASAEADNGATYIHDLAGRVYQRAAADDLTLDLRWFGGVGDGTTLNNDAFQTAFDLIAALGGGVLRVPSGTWKCANDGTAMRIKSSIRIVGDGRESSIILFDDSAGASRQDLLRVFGDTGAYDIAIEGLWIKGDWGTGDYDERSHLVELQLSGGSVVLRDNRFSDSRFMATITGGADSVHASGNEYLRIRRDGCRVTDCPKTIVSDNFFSQVVDDAIAIHTVDAQAEPVENSAVVAGNRIVDSQGIAILGAKEVTVTGNSLSRVHTRAIEIGAPGSTEGNTAVKSITVTANVIDTVFNGYLLNGADSGGTVIYIDVTGAVPSALSGGYVGLPDGSGAILQPYDYFNTNDTDATAPATGAWFVNISDNVCVRTLAPTTNYSDYGFAVRLGQNGTVDPAVTEAMLGISENGAGIALRNFGHNVLIADNLVDGLFRGIHCTARTAAAYVAFRNLVLDGNVLSNFRYSGIELAGTGKAHLRNNSFSGDPLHIHPARLANGKWSASWADNAAIYTDTMKADIVGCEFRDVGSIYRGASPNNMSWRGNLAHADPAVYGGYDANNIGIGYFPALPEWDAQLVVEDGDPASATFGTVLNVCPNGASAMPSAGKFLRGHVVKNSLPAVAGAASSQYVISGWVRLTTGSAHVLNTDWAEMRTLTGT